MPSALPTLCYGGRCQQKAEESVTRMDPIIHLRTGPATPSSILHPTPASMASAPSEEQSQFRLFCTYCWKLWSHTPLHPPTILTMSAWAPSASLPSPCWDTALVLDPHTVSLTQERLSSSQMVIPRSRAPRSPDPLTPSLHSRAQHIHLPGPALRIGRPQGPGRIALPGF